MENDRPSLESSSYLNVTLRYLGPWDPLTLGFLDLRTLGPLSSCFLLPPFNSSYLFYLLFIFYLSPMVRYGLGGWGCQMTCELINEEMSMLLCSKKFLGGGLLEI